MLQPSRLQPGDRSRLSETYLIVGGDGLIGKGLVMRLKNHSRDVYATTRRGSDAADEINLDLAEPGSFPDAFRGFEHLPSGSKLTVFVCGGITGFGECESDPARTRRVNVDGTSKLAERLLPLGAFLVFLSSTAVFGGDATVDESSATNPLTEYGRQKADAEAHLVAAGRDARNGGVAIVRLTKVLSRDKGRIREWIAALGEGTIVRAAKDVAVCPISLGHGVESLITVASRRLPGVFHVSGERGVSYHELATRLADALASGKDRVEPADVREAGPLSVSQPACLSMEATTRRVGILPQPIEDVIRELAGDSRVYGR